MFMDPLPNIYRVYSLLIQQERQTTIPLDESKVLAFPSQNNNSQYKRNLSYCGKGIIGGIFHGGRGRVTQIFNRCEMKNHTVDFASKSMTFLLIDIRMVQSTIVQL